MEGMKASTRGAPAAGGQAEDPSSGRASAAGDPGVVLERYCPYFHHSIELLGRRWSGAVLLAMHDGVERFGELRDAVPGLSDRLLVERLRELQNEGIVVRVAEHGDVRYRLTDKGRDLRPVLEALALWTQTHCAPTPHHHDPGPLPKRGRLQPTNHNRSPKARPPAVP